MTKLITATKRITFARLEAGWGTPIRSLASHAKAFILAVALLAVPVTPAATLTAHVVGSYSGNRSSGAHACIYDISFEGTRYSALHNGMKCDASLTGKDVPAKIEKHRIELTLPSGKTLKLEIVGTREEQ